MKTKYLGIIIIAVGILMMVYTGFNIVTTEKVVDVGSLQINKAKDNPVHWPPIIGGIILVAGIVVVVTAKKE